MNKPWHSLKLDEVFKSLETTPEGLLQSAASERLKRYGLNKIAEPEKVSALKILIGELTGFFNTHSGNGGNEKDRRSSKMTCCYNHMVIFHFVYPSL